MGGVWPMVGFSIFVGLMMAVIANSFALRNVTYKSQTWEVWKVLIFNPNKPFTKQCKVFGHSNWIAVCSLCSSPSAKTGSLICLEFFCWKALQNRFLYCLFCTRFFARCWALCPLSCFFYWRRLSSALYERFIHCWKKFFY